MAVFKLNIAPDELEGLRSSGGTIDLLFAHLGIKEDIITAVCEEGGFEPTEDAGTVAYILDEEWEALISKLRIGGGSRLA